jgi:hypothetical protein
MAQRQTPDDLAFDEELPDGSGVSEAQEDNEMSPSEFFERRLRLSEALERIEETREYIQSALGSRAIIVDALYPPLTLVENAENGINFNYHIAPTSYNESFKSRWSSEEQAHGYLNPIFSYGGTEREVSMSFVLPAMTVAQARDNLSQCSKLSRTVYGRYRHLNTSTENSDTIRVFSGERTFIVDFGSLIRDEKAVVSAFTFAVNPDAGVFDYEAGEDTDVTHSTRGLVLPRAVSVDITFVFIHDHPLGFGGRRRIEGIGDLKWAENRNRDWPHGTGPIPVQEYMSEDSFDTRAEYDSLTAEQRAELMLSRNDGEVYTGPPPTPSEPPEGEEQ